MLMINLILLFFLIKMLIVKIKAYKIYAIIKY